MDQKQKDGKSLTSPNVKKTQIPNHLRQNIQKELQQSQFDLIMQKGDIIEEKKRQEKKQQLKLNIEEREEISDEVIIKPIQIKPTSRLSI